MNTSLDLSLRDLRAAHPHQHGLITQLLHIQDNYLLHNLKSLSWVSNLHCLSTHSPLARKRKLTPRLPGPARPHTLTRTAVNGRAGNYIAISYPWDASSHPGTTDDPRTGGIWRICTSASRAHAASAVRDVVLTRAARCAEALGCPNLWLDRECVPQDPGPENEAALHTMDLVYQFSAWPVALLFNPIAGEAELRVFESVMGLELLEAREAGRGADVLREGVEQSTAAEALSVLKWLTDDPWWGRAWTFQENYCAGAKMNLLIPLNERKRRQKRRRRERWRTGDVPGELLVSSVEFHKAATRFCLAYLKSDFILDADKQTCRMVIQKAGRYYYTMLPDGTTGVTDYSRTMTNRILEDIAHRNARFRADLLPIASNCCQYGARLDTNRLYGSDTHLSVCILSLWLLNGEIFKGEAKYTTSELQNMTIFDYLQAVSLDNFSPPVQGGQLTFLKSCRFVDVSLSEYGVTTSGWLWKVDRRISTRDPKFRREGRHKKGKAGQEHSEPPERLLKVLADELHNHGCHELAGLLKKNGYFSDADKKWNSKGGGTERPIPAETYMRIAASNLERSIAKGHAVLLARLWDGQSEDDGDVLPPHTAIFIGDRELSEGEATSTSFVPTYAFTAWSGRSCDDDRNVEESQIDKYVSLEVFVDEERANGLPFLKTNRWLNGLCFFSRHAEMDVTFAWPPGLSDKPGEEAGVD
ncbi:hypothetical protein B0J12DRAFT_571540 [Macrophomina phaseolina]|uniref:Heterokaryon incompatibility domain-containing protein n=1 Tax=Macrophomina phaseolina TaxID=35725 RepID=A0ABQ8GE59_9PEZI|nr:hypothetical protein B0J12DRAFT_571540 [Macrophomina phaseolina]